MKEDNTRPRAIADIANLRFRARKAQRIDRDEATQIIDQAFSIWMRVDGDPLEEDFVRVMGRLALHAMAHRQIEMAETIVQSGYAPCRDAWALSSGRGYRIVGGLAHCLASMESEVRLRVNLPERAQVLEAALARPDWWSDVLDVDSLHHGIDALVATENAHWSDLRKRRGANNEVLHAERARFEQALIRAGCPVAREDTHHSLLAAAMPEFTSSPVDTRLGLEHVRQVVEWGGGGTAIARASAWTAAIRRDVHQVLTDPSKPGPRVALLDELGVAIEAPSRSHVHAGVALAALQKGYLPVVDRLVAKAKGFDWLDENDKAGILAKLGGRKAEVAEAVSRVPMGWLAPVAESRVNAITVQVAEFNVALLERAIEEGWPLEDAMGQRKTPLKTMASRNNSSGKAPDAIQATLRCLVHSCDRRGVDVDVDDSLLKLAVGLRDLESLETLWGWSRKAGIGSAIEALMQACCRTEMWASAVEAHSEKSVDIFDFLWERQKGDPEPETIAQWLRDCLCSRNRPLFDRISPLAGELTGSAWPSLPLTDDMERIEDLAHMVDTMANKGADAQPPSTWLMREPLLGAVLAVRSRYLLSAQTPAVAAGSKVVRI